jgi:glutamate/tyrosine decarboxylase-like PLP-dependent enzyme
VPVECGCALVRDQQAMRDAHLVPPYLRDDTTLPWLGVMFRDAGFRAQMKMTLQQVGKTVIVT